MHLFLEAASGDISIEEKRGIIIELQHPTKEVHQATSEGPSEDSAWEKEFP
jgi:hypothetical protein